MWGKFITALACVGCVLLLAAPARGAFPGANGKIAFVSGRDGNPEIYTVNADGSAVTRLTNDPAGDFEPAWSADGTKIAFASTRGLPGCSGLCNDIYVMNADGTGVTRLTSDPADDERPTWSPDGSKIAFQTYRDGNFEVYVMNADGTNQSNLTNHAHFDGRPRWSPDGSKIAFDTARDTFEPGGVVFHSEIYSMNVDGTDQANITRDNIANPDAPSTNAHPDWSPDGLKIAFDVSGPSAEIHVINADGSGKAALTSSPPGTANVSPAWSPDGTKMAFLSTRDDPNGEIYTMNADGTGVTRLTDDPTYASFPAWQPRPAPKRGDYKTSQKFCEAEQKFLGDAAFAKKYSTNRNGADAFGKCVSGN